MRGWSTCPDLEKEGGREGGRMYVSAKKKERTDHEKDVCISNTHSSLRLQTL
jgi:hypothetical protein